MGYATVPSDDDPAFSFQNVLGSVASADVMCLRCARCPAQPLVFAAEDVGRASSRPTAASMGRCSARDRAESHAGELVASVGHEGDERRCELGLQRATLAGGQSADDHRDCPCYLGYPTLVLVEVMEEPAHRYLLRAHRGEARALEQAARTLLAGHAEDAWSPGLRWRHVAPLDEDPAANRG